MHGCHPCDTRRECSSARRVRIPPWAPTKLSCCHIVPVRLKPLSESVKDLSSFSMSPRGSRIVNRKEKITKKIVSRKVKDKTWFSLGLAGSSCLSAIIRYRWDRLFRLAWTLEIGEEVGYREIRVSRPSASILKRIGPMRCRGLTLWLASLYTRRCSPRRSAWDRRLNTGILTR
jgi:hypothetical protein